MKTKVVNSEDPQEHWSDIEDVHGKIVLDLGCGWLFQPHESTPEYFINRGASTVVGVDAACGEIDELKQKYPNHIFVCKMIQNEDDIAELLHEYKPNIVKMDIEGYESVISKMQKSDFDSVCEIAIEYHNPTCKSILDKYLPIFGFEIKNVNQFGWFVTDTNVMGIMHAVKTP